MNFEFVKKYWFWIWVVTFWVTVYCLFFFATPFEPYSVLGNETPTRFSFFSYILLPDEYFAAWLGRDLGVALTERAPILFVVFFCLTAACGIGSPLIQRTIRIPVSRPEYLIFATTAGLNIISVLLFWFYFLNQWNSSTVLWLFSVAVLIAGNIAFLFQKRCDLTIFTEKRLFRYWIAGFRFCSFNALTILSLIVFSLLLIFGGMIPSTDYDVLSYHLAGAREFAESGQIGFLPHNVYANMPFGAEMFYVWGMTLTGNPFTGAMIGKTLIAVTTILTAFGLYAFNKRFFSKTAGLVAMILYISMPWIIYVSAAGLIDSVVGMNAFFTIYAVTLGTERKTKTETKIKVEVKAERKTETKIASILHSVQKDSNLFLAGFFAGSAAACKYPAVLLVAVPIGIFIAIRANNASKRSAGQRYPFQPLFRYSFRLFFVLKPVLVYVLAVLIACGGWYFKNYYYTGNPVYPLCFSLFGDSTGSWNTETDARWTKIHSPHDFHIATFIRDFGRVVMSSPWNSPMLIPLFLLVFVVKTETEMRRRHWLLLAWIFCAFSVWWFLTHRLDRFWLPAVPVLALIAGVGATWRTEKYWKIILTVLLIFSCAYCFLVGGAAAPGKNNRFFFSLHAMQYDLNISTRWAVWFNKNPPENQGKILLIGEAKAFLYDVPVLYHSCFNETPLKEIITNMETSVDPVSEFQRRKIAFILVDWGEINRFRSPGNYGFSEFIQQKVFDRLLADKILERYCPTKELAESQTIVYRVRNK